MSDNDWTDSDDALFNMAALPSQHPTRLSTDVALLIIQRGPIEAIAAYATPESADGRKGFPDGSAVLSEPRLSLLGTPRQYADACDVAYVRVARDPDWSLRMTHGAEEVEIAATFTWVWRPELGGWRLHHIGRPVPLDEIPRTSPNSAPDIDGLPIE